MSASWPSVSAAPLKSKVSFVGSTAEPFWEASLETTSWSALDEGIDPSQEGSEK
jgi:hypothetical protein